MRQVSVPAAMASSSSAIRNRGFTLLEVLVALAILAVALAAALRATGLAAGQTEALRDRLGATWVAQNRVALHRAMHEWPSPGEYSGDAEQAGMRFAWQEVVSNTPNPAFRRIAVRVYAAQAPAETLATLTAYLVHEPEAPGAPPAQNDQQSGTQPPPATDANNPDANNPDAIPSGSEADAGGPSPEELKAQELRAQEKHESY